MLYVPGQNTSERLLSGILIVSIAVLTDQSCGALLSGERNFIAAGNLAAKTHKCVAVLRMSVS